MPGRLLFLFPILEHSSLEDDPDLTTRWAMLLANAASSSTDSLVVLPGFPDILSQLTPFHANLLQYLYDQGFRGDFEERSTITRRFNLREAHYRVLVVDLHRLQLVEGRHVLYRPVRRGESLLGPSDYSSITLTPLGSAFVHAVSPPPFR